MLKGIKFLSRPSVEQKKKLHQWMGCSRFIWNAKCDEDFYLRSYCFKYLPIGTYPPIDQSYAQYKTELSPWLSDCPSPILRNSCSNWFKTYQKFLKGECGRPRRKKKFSGNSILLTKELFCLEQDEFKNWKLFVGAKKNNIGYLPLHFHTKEFAKPNSIRIRMERGQFYVSFCYEDELDEKRLWDLEQYLDHFKNFSSEELDKITLGVDRGIKVPVQAEDFSFDLSEQGKKKKREKEKYLKRCQRKLAKQTKGSKRREKTKKLITKTAGKISDIRKNFCHQTSHSLVNSEAKILVFEDLKIKNMTSSAKGTQEKPGKRVKAKAGLNRSILDQGWGMLENFLSYKCYRAEKAFFKISAYQTSQECADCGHIHPENRKTQKDFCCIVCGHTDNADRNASIICKKRAIKLILNSGTELSKRGVLIKKREDIGRGGEDVFVEKQKYHRRSVKNDSVLHA